DPAVRQLKSGKHRVVVPENGMSSDVYERTIAGRRGSERFSRSGLIQKHRGPGKQTSDGPYFLRDERRLLIGNPHEKIRVAPRVIIWKAVLQDNSAWGVRNVEPVDEISLTVEKRMKWHQVQRSMRNDHNAWGSNALCHSGHQIGIKFLQMPLGCRHDLLGM